jgi:hypothetical protein
VLTSGVETNKKIREASHGVDPLVITHYIPNVDAWIHNHYKGKPEVFYTWPWSRDPHEIFNLVASVLRRWLRGLDKQPQPLLVTFRSSVNKICEAVDADNAPCNLIGHSFGGIMTAFAVGRGINSKGHGVSYEATLAAPFNWYAQNGKAFWNYPGVHFAGDYANFTEKAPVLKLWSNSTNKINSLTPLSIQVPTFEDNGYANFQAHTNLHHADFWADNATIARVTALGICLARKHYYEWGGNALCHKS